MMSSYLTISMLCCAATLNVAEGVRELRGPCEPREGR